MRIGSPGTAILQDPEGDQAQVLLEAATQTAGQLALHTITELVGHDGTNLVRVPTHLSGAVVEGAILGATVKNPSLQEDETLNNSGKSLTVPTNTLWHLLWVQAELTTTANAGNRQMTLRIRDTANDTLLQISAGVVQAASLTRHYNWVTGGPRESAFVDVEVMIPFPPDVWLLTGFDIFILDSSTIHVAGDDLIIHILVDEYSV